MNILDVSRLLEEIRTCAGDDEHAHALEDELHTKVLEAIASGACKDPQGCARLALTSKDIEFARWYA